MLVHQLLKNFSFTTSEDKGEIFGLNAAKIFKVNIEAQRNGIPNDYMSQYKAIYKDPGILRDNFYYSWSPGE